MASSVIYPPIVDSYMPAFRAGVGTCRIYFSLSKFNNDLDITKITAHATVVEQKTNMNVVNTSNPGMQTGIIINLSIQSDVEQENIYYIEIPSSAIKGQWKAGWIYKVQIRLSAIEYNITNPPNKQGEEQWLNTINNIQNFSEWSTICVVKAIEDIEYIIPMFNITIDVNGDKHNTIIDNTITDSSIPNIPEMQITFANFSGHFNHKNLSENKGAELIYKYNIIIYNKNNKIIEESGDIYANQYQDNDSFNYPMKTEFKDGQIYKIAFKFETINGYIGGNYKFDDEDDDRIIFKEVDFYIDDAPCQVITVDTEYKEMFDNSVLNMPHWWSKGVNKNGNHNVSVAGLTPELDKTKRKYTMINGVFDIDGEAITGWTEEYFNKYIYVYCDAGGHSNYETDVIIDGEPIPFTFDKKEITIDGNTVTRISIKVDNQYAYRDFVANIYYAEAIDLEHFSSVFEEEEEGRVALKFYDMESKIYSGNLLVCRASSRDNFKKWEEIYLYTAKQEYINNIPIFYDYTIESGVWYRYSVQSVNEDGTKSNSRINSTSIIRNFNYSFLLGQDNQQLKLQFDNTMNSFKYQIYDSKTDPIGNTYPIISRNANTKYRTFPMNGLISFNMDENNLFMTKKKVYSYEDVADLYNTYNSSHNIGLLNDFNYEREFRQKVLEFLQDGEFKLFKSPTEGNIIIRLTDVVCTPNQSLDRMIYSFSANAYEMDEINVPNYKKYKFITVKDPKFDFALTKTKLGQLYRDFAPEENVFDLIKELYNSQESQAGYVYNVKNIHHIKITFDDKPMVVEINEDEITKMKKEVIGYRFELNDHIFIIRAYTGGIYEFDNRMIYNISNKLKILNDVSDIEGDKKRATVHATIDFLYDVEIKPYKPRQIKNREGYLKLGQFFKYCEANENIFDYLKSKYFYDLKTGFRYIDSLKSIEIEADPGMVFGITDRNEVTEEKHVVGETGQLRFYNIENITNVRYLGIQDSETGLTLPEGGDVIMNYIGIIVKGEYK